MPSLPHSDASYQDVVIYIAMIATANFMTKNAIALVQVSLHPLMKCTNKHQPTDGVYLRSAFTAVIALLALSVPISLTVAGPNEKLPELPRSETAKSRVDFWPASPHCGPSSLYLFLRMHGIDISVDDVKKRVPATDKGTSLHDIHRSAVDFGIDNARVVRTSSANLSQFQFPVIALLADGGVANNDTGHFVLITDEISGAIRGIDGTSHQRFTYTPEAFGQQFTGYLVGVDRTASFSDHFDTLLGGLCIAAAMVALVMAYRVVINSRR